MNFNELPENMLVRIERDPKKISAFSEIANKRGVVVSVHDREGNFTKNDFILCNFEGEAKPKKIMIVALLDHEDLVRFLNKKLKCQSRKVQRARSGLIRLFSRFLE